MNDERHPHAEVIDSHGGPTKVAERMGILSEPGSVQRVSNWKRRGIPAEVRLDHPWLNAAALAERQEAA